MFSQQNALARQRTGIIRMDLWVSRQQLAVMLAWCHKRFASGDWSYHRHCEPLLSKGAVVARFYFQHADDARDFGERLQSPARGQRKENLDRRFY